MYIEILAKIYKKILTLLKIKEVIPNYKKEYEKLKKEIADKNLEIEVLRELVEKKRIAQKKELK